jgi:hypothetical protein
LKESLKKIVFSSNISKIPEFILNKETQNGKRKREKRNIEKRERKKRAKSLSLLKTGI